MKKRMIISVTNKEGLRKFKALSDMDWEIISTGGTMRELQSLGIPCTAVETVTGFPEMLGGRIKTLHPKISGGILANRSKPGDLEIIAQYGIELIDIVVVNLYDFDGNPDIEQIDIGGPTLLRAGAKNGASVTVVVDPDDYDKVIEEIIKHGDTTLATREKLAIKVFQETSKYDGMIARWMEEVRMNGVSFFTTSPSSIH